MKTGSQSEDPFKTGSERMRGQFAGAILLGIAAVANANAADLSGGQGIGGGYGPLRAIRFAMDQSLSTTIEPGVIVRCYWCPPWQNRHYFPRTGHRPKVGRREILPARRMQKPQEFYRYWSISSVFAPQLSPGGARGAAGSVAKAGCLSVRCRAFGGSPRKVPASPRSTRSGF